MSKYRIFELYDILTIEERSKVRLWLQFRSTPKQVKQTLAFYDALQGRKNPQKIWRKLFSELPFDHKKFKKICERLTRMFEEYLSWKQISRHKIEQDSFTVRELSQRENARLFEKEIEKINNRLEAQKLRDHKYFRIKFELKALKQQHLIIMQDPSREDQYRELSQSHFDMLLLEFLRGSVDR